MSEKRWTDDERSEAFERGLKTMEGVALELYRRGREPLLEELETVKRERDEALAACPDCAMWAERSARWHEDMQRAERERDEWRDKFLALNQTAGEFCNACGWAFKIPGESCRCEVVKERDEARRARDQYLRERDLALRAEERWRESLEALEEAIDDCLPGDDDDAPLDCVERAGDKLRELARERDEARADAERCLADLRRCASEPYERTRELEALQAEVERLRETNDYLRTWLSSEELEGLRVKAAEHPLLWEEIHHLKAEVERLREKYDSVLEANVGLLDGAPYVDARVAFRRGAEAMREACAVALMSDGLVLSRERAANVVRALPIPEEP